VRVKKCTWPIGHFFLYLCLLGCGNEFVFKTETASPQEAFVPKDPSTIRLPGLDKISIEGAIVSAFEITVDGVRYQDSEDFYSQEVTRLPEKAAVAGFPDWEARFEAILGFADLARGMTVYVAPTGNAGYTGSASVSADGQFRIELPADGKWASYNIRAVKRVNVLLTKEKETRRFCYNFSANLNDVSVNESSLPFVLGDFQTRWTLYSCDKSSPSSSSRGSAVPLIPVGRPPTLYELNTLFELDNIR
jgi:hypothetical protein